MQRTSSCAANNLCSLPTTSVIIEDVRVLCKTTCQKSASVVGGERIDYLLGEETSSVGGLRVVLSPRFFETACSRNEDLVFASLLAFEKLPVCDLFMLRENILWVYRDYREICQLVLCSCNVSISVLGVVKVGRFRWNYLSMVDLALSG